MINYCLDNDIGILIVGYNETFQKDSNIDKSNNEILQDKLEYLCKSNGIILVMQEESYTTKAASEIRNAISIYNSDKISFQR